MTAIQAGTIDYFIADVSKNGYYVFATASELHLVTALSQ